MDTNEGNFFSDGEIEDIRRKLKKVKVRKHWPEGFSPITRIVPNKKVYKRQKFRGIRENYDV